jgi:hypothetical protein
MPGCPAVPISTWGFTRLHHLEEVVVGRRRGRTRWAISSALIANSPVFVEVADLDGALDDEAVLSSTCDARIAPARRISRGPSRARRRTRPADADAGGACARQHEPKVGDLAAKLPRRCVDAGQRDSRRALDVVVEAGHRVSEAAQDA